MKTLIATAIVALGLLSTAAQAAQYPEFAAYPDWAQRAFGDARN